MNASPFILPPSGVLRKVTPSFSNLSQAAYTSGTVIPMWPNPRGSSLPLWYFKSGSFSVPQLCVSSTAPAWYQEIVTARTKALGNVFAELDKLEKLQNHYSTRTHTRTHTVPGSIYFIFQTIRRQNVLATTDAQQVAPTRWADQTSYRSVLHLPPWPKGKIRIFFYVAAVHTCWKHHRVRSFGSEGMSASLQ